LDLTTITKNHWQSTANSSVTPQQDQQIEHEDEEADHAEEQAPEG
jgi:hypothetical protein